MEGVTTLPMADDSYDPWQTMSLRNYEEKPPVYRKHLIQTNNISDIIGAKPSSKSASFSDLFFYWQTLSYSDAIHADLIHIVLPLQSEKSINKIIIKRTT